MDIHLNQVESCVQSHLEHRMELTHQIHSSLKYLGWETLLIRSIDLSMVDIRVLIVELRKEKGSSRRDYMAKFGYTNQRSLVQI